MLGRCHLVAGPGTLVRMHPLERALVTTVRRLAFSLAVSVPLVAVPTTDHPLRLFLGQMAVIVIFGIALAIRLSALVEAPGWFVEADWPEGRRRLAAASAIVALVTGAVALVTLASSAALRLEPSLQFLQLLSTMDIAWTGAAIAIGSYLRWGTRAAWIGGGLLGVFCIYSIWSYLDAVGFTADGGWVVSGSDLMRHVIPFDVAAAVMAVGILSFGAYAGLPTEQARPQS